MMIACKIIPSSSPGLQKERYTIKFAFWKLSKNVLYYIYFDFFDFAAFWGQCPHAGETAGETNSWNIRTPLYDLEYTDTTV